VTKPATTVPADTSTAATPSLAVTVTTPTLPASAVLVDMAALPERELALADFDLEAELESVFEREETEVASATSSGLAACAEPDGVWGSQECLWACGG
jgi:hypothetical protein